MFFAALTWEKKKRVYQSKVIKCITFIKLVQEYNIFFEHDLLKFIEMTTQVKFLLSYDNKLKTNDKLFPIVITGWE